MRNNNNSSNRKQGHTSRIQQLQNVPYRFWKDKQLSERDGTLQCTAGPAWYVCHSTNDTLANTWTPAVGQPVRVRWVPRSTQKNSGKNNCGSHTERRLQAKALHITIEIVCSTEKRSLVAPEYSEESLRCNLQKRQAFRMKELPRVRIDIEEARKPQTV